MTQTSRDPNTVTVTALKTQETPTTTECLLGILHMENTLTAERVIAATVCVCACVCVCVCVCN